VKLTPPPYGAEVENKCTHGVVKTEEQ